eukprot:SAG11_NODE_35549_length_266_cov_0.616766_1_plen_68_part_10
MYQVEGSDFVLGTRPDGTDFPVKIRTSTDISGQKPSREQELHMSAARLKKKTDWSMSKKKPKRQHIFT